MPKLTPSPIVLGLAALLVACAMGLAQPPYVVRDLIVSSGTSSAGSDVDETIMLGNIAIFAARDGINGRELWRTDGTIAGTYLVMDIRPGSPDSLPRDFTVHNGFVYFSADDGVRGRELWRTDGTTAGTSLVRDTRPGSASGDVERLSSAGGRLFFNAAIGQGASPTLWTSDGTTAGTVPVSVLAPCCLADGTCVMLGTEACALSGGRQQTVGTTCESVSCPQTIVACCLPELPCAMMTLSDCIAAGGTTEPKGGCADESSCASTPVACCLPSGTCANMLYSQCIAAGGFAFPGIQSCFDGCSGVENPYRTATYTPVVLVDDTLVFGGAGFLWLFDPETLSTTPLATFSQLTPVENLTVNGVRAFFSAQTDAHGRELWVTDGTAGGTMMVADIKPGPADSIDSSIGALGAQIAAVGDSVLFRADDGTNGKELWRSDGTEAGTAMVIDLYSNTGGSMPRRFSLYNGELYFMAQIPTSFEALIRSDGTEAGTIIVKGGFTLNTDTLVVLGTRLVHNGLFYFVADVPNDGRELWRTDGTEAGTLRLTDQHASGGGAQPGAMMPFADRIVFAAPASNSGRELWETDGTAEGTVFFANLNSRSPSFSSTIQPGIGDVAFLMAPTPSSGLELHRTAGTPETTWMVKDIAPGSQGTVINEMLMFNGRLHFTATRSTNPPFSNALWSSDGTDAGTAPIGDLAPPGGSGGVGEAGITFGDSMLFVAGTGYTGQELWKTDGTPAGTALLKEIRPGTLSGLDLPNVFVEFDGRVWFGANDGTNGPELWSTDGTAAGTVMFADLTPGTNNNAVREFKVLGGVLLFTYANTLWRTDGTPGGTFSLNDGTGPNLPEAYFEFDGAVYFRARRGGTTTGVELWKTDGTPAGTGMVKDINPGSADSYPGRFCVHNGELLFTANSPTGLDIWRTDGTGAGTTLALDLANSTQPHELFVYDDQLFFTQSNSGRIWQTDLTLPGTVIMLSSGHNSPPFGFTEFNGILYFITAAGFPATGGEIWRTDGTEAGTYVALDLVPGIGESNPGPLTLLNGKFLFSAQTSSHGREPWSFDPTTLIAVRLADIAPGTDSSSPQVLAVRGESAFVRASNPNDGSLLFRTGGAPATTEFIIDPDIYRQVLSGRNLTATDTHLFLTDTGQTPRTLFATDGTAAGNVQVRMFPHPGELRSLVSFDGSLFLGANDTGVGLELHRAEPVENGISLVADFFPGPTGSGPNRAVRVGDELFYSAAPSSAVGTELCVTDGTAAGTRLVRDLSPGAQSSNPSSIVNLNGLAIFVATTDAEGQEIWRSDGTEAGTYMLADIWPGSTGSAPMNLTVLPGRVVFSADDGVHGRELWSTNGTTVGTMMLVDLWEGPGGSQPAWITRAPGRVFFSAYTPDTGTELWTSNGSAFGTARVIDLVEGPSSAAVTGLTVAGSRLYFFATAVPDPTSLWAIEWNTAVANICFADYDTSGGVGVADIFALLSDWFAGRPRADVDGDGEIAVPDVFAFLSLWFANCG